VSSSLIDHSFPLELVHERSVDTDILCLLCRRLLVTNTSIRLILMSATLAAALYQEYFDLPNPPLKVGARRFPVEEVYLDDLNSRFNLPVNVKKAVATLKQGCDTTKCRVSPSSQTMEKLHVVACHLALAVGSPGSSVLIFVPGMMDIVSITERIEQIYVVGIRFTTFPIHSDIPFEDQMNVFAPAESDEVKIIIATNAAESSVTLPDVDHVICLGLCKQILYNELSHRQILMPTWISKASATQRAGRTGRLRPGTCYRLYTRQSFEEHMADFEPGEILRIPLDSVILMLKEMLKDEEVGEVLQDCIEPPNTTTIQRSFQSLYESQFITAPSGDCDITQLGLFVSALGVDLALGSLVGLGIQFGVAAEVLQLAGILSFPQPPWIMSNPLVHDAASFNGESDML
jgi:HrpA-like RNA helicase